MSPNEPLPTPAEAQAIMGAFRVQMELFQKLVMDVEKSWADLAKAVDMALREGERLVGTDSAANSVWEWVKDVSPFQEALVETLEDIRRAFAKVSKAIDELLPKIRKVAERSRPVADLCEHSFRYLSEVFAPLGSLHNAAGSMSPDAYYWSGPTRDHYDAEVKGAQRAAIGKVTDHVGTLSGWLGQTAAKNTDYMVNIVHNVSPIAQSLTEAAANAAAASVDFVSVFFTLDSLAATIGNCVQAILDQTASLFGFLVNVVAGIRDLAQVKWDRREVETSASGAAVWPQSVAG